MRRDRSLGGTAGSVALHAALLHGSPRRDREAVQERRVRRDRNFGTTAGSVALHAALLHGWLRRDREAV